MSRIRPEVRHAIVLMAGTGVTAILGIIYGIYATRRLDAGAVGEFTHALSVVALLQLALGPINGTVAKFVAEYAAAGRMGQVRSLVAEVARRVARYGSPALILALVAAFPLATFWRYQSPAPLLAAFVATYVAVLLSVVRGALRGLESFGSLNASTIFEAACRLAFGLPLLYLWVSATTAMLPYVLGAGAALLVSSSLLGRSWSGVPAEALDGRAVRRFVGPMLLLMSASAAFQNMDMMVVKRVFDPAQADVYGISFYLTGRAMAVMVAPFTTLMLPMMASATGSSGERRMLLLRVSGIFVALAAIPLGLLAIWPQPVIQVLYGDRFAAAAPLLFPLAATRLMGYLAHMIALANAASGRFEFLVVYLVGLAAEFVALLLWNATATQVVTVLLAVQGFTFLLMAVQFLTGFGRRSPRSVGAGE